MDGIHDLGGKLGYGAVDTSGDGEPAFHAPWEARMWGIAMSYSRPADFNSPKFRYTRELEEPVIYLTRPYLDQWYMAHACMLLGAGLVSVEELGSGIANETAVGDWPAPMSAEDVDRIKHGIDASARVETADARYRVGDTVIARNVSSPGHTRLPAYVRGHRGVITACHGAQPLDDALAHGERRIEPLYTVRFNLSDLFPEQRDSADRVHVELWQSYLHDPGDPPA